jgi:hypothetical protein
VGEKKKERNKMLMARIDETGHHLTTGCGMHGTRHDQHDMLVLELSHMTAYCGYITRRKPLGCFHSQMKAFIN